MRPARTRPSRRMLHLAMAMQAPLDRHPPIATAISTKPDDQPLDLHQAEREDAKTQK